MLSVLMLPVAYLALTAKEVEMAALVIFASCAATFLLGRPKARVSTATIALAPTVRQRVALTGADDEQDDDEEDAALARTEIARRQYASR